LRSAAIHNKVSKKFLICLEKSFVIFFPFIDFKMNFTLEESFKNDFSLTNVLRTYHGRKVFPSGRELKAERQREEKAKERLKRKACDKIIGFLRST
jgi:hypothetical protein